MLNVGPPVDYSFDPYPISRQIEGNEPPTIHTPETDDTLRLSIGQAKIIALQNNRRIAYLSYIPRDRATVVQIALAEFDPKLTLEV